MLTEDNKIRILKLFFEEYYKSYFGEKLVEDFNRYRIIRNNIMYCANSINKADTIKALDVAIKLYYFTCFFVKKHTNYAKMAL